MSNLNDTLRVITDLFYDELNTAHYESVKFTNDSELLKIIKLLNSISEIVEIRPDARFSWSSYSSGYIKNVNFEIYCKFNDDIYKIALQGENLKDENFRTLTNGAGLRTSWNSGSADIGKHMKKFMLKHGINLFLMLTNTHSSLLNYKYVEPMMAKRSKQTFSIIGDEYSKLSIPSDSSIYKVNYRSEGWSSTYKRVYDEVKKYNNDNSDVLNKIDDLLKTIWSYRQDIGAFSIDIGTKTLKIDTFYTINGVSGDIRNYSHKEILKIISDFIILPHIYNNGRYFIDARHLIEMFRLEKPSYGGYSLVQTKARNNRVWSPIRLEEDDLEDLVALAEKYNDPDDIAAWRVLPEIRG